jgi:hypothetical protein
MRSASTKLTENDLTGKLLSALNLDEFYTILDYPPSGRIILSSALKTIVLPSICVDGEEFSTFPFTNHPIPSDTLLGGWSLFGRDCFPSKVMPTGWTRCVYALFRTIAYTERISL